MIRFFPFLFTVIILLSGKNTPAQNWNWAKSIGDTTGNTAIYAMSPYPGSAVLVVGSYGSKTLELGSHTISNNGIIDIFVALADSSGTYQWAQGFGGTIEERATAITADKNGNIYVLGNFSSLSVKFGSTTLYNKGESDGFLVKINAQKNVEWAMSFGGATVDDMTGISTDNEGNVYVTGYTIDFQSNVFSMFVAKIDASKNILWKQTGNTAGWNLKTSSIVIDEEQNCYVAGGFSDVLSFDGKNQITSTKGGEPPYEYYDENAFVVKFSKTGEFIQAMAIPTFSKVNDMATFSSDLYLCGEKINYGIGWGWPLRDSKIFVSKFSNDLKPLWEQSAGGLTFMQSLDVANSISADDEGNVYLTGSFFSEKLEFAGNSLMNFFNRDYYHQQTFVLKYDSNGNELWGKAIGENLCEVGYQILATSNNRYYLSGTFESNTIKFGEIALENNSNVREVYVHLRPKRQSRNTFAFLARHGTIEPSANPIVKVNSTSIFPNPANNYFNIKLNESNHSGGKVSIYSHEGRLIQTLPINPDAMSLHVETGNLRNGIYVVKVKIGNNVSMHKVVKK